MTRQDQIFKWFIYALGLLPIWLLDAFLLGRYPVFSTKPLLLPLAVAAVAVMEGSFAGAGFGLGVGLLWSVSYAGNHTGMVLFLVLAGMWVGLTAQYALTQGFLGYLLCSAGTLGALEGLHILWGLFTQTAPLTVLLEVAGRELLCSLVWTPLVYLIFRAVFARVGLDKLA